MLCSFINFIIFKLCLLVKVGTFYVIKHILHLFSQIVCIISLILLFLQCKSIILLVCINSILCNMSCLSTYTCANALAFDGMNAYKPPEVR